MTHQHRDALVVESSNTVSRTARRRVTDTALLQRFLSLGHDCEFGFVQRFGGVETLGLFRFTLVPAASFLQAAAEQFQGVEAPTSIDIFEDERTSEWLSRIEPYGFVFHTGHYVGSSDPEIVRQEQGRRLSLLRRIFLEDLERPRKTFVRFGFDPDEDIAAIAKVISQYGEGVLVHVKLADATRSGGSVERISDNLIYGYLDRYWVPLTNRFDVLTDQWMSICRNVDAMLSGESNAKTLAPYRCIDRVNLLGDNTPRMRIKGSSASIPDGTSRAHVLLTDSRFPEASIEAISVEDGLECDVVYVFSFDVWVPAEFKGESIVPIFVGLPALQYFGADLARREEWQSVWVSSKCPSSKSLLVAVAIEGVAGDMAMTRNWRLLEGCHP